LTITINQITSGMGIRVDNTIYVVSDYSHVKPGKGSAFVRVKLKNLKNGLVIDRTFKSSEKLDDIFLEERTLQFLYQSDHSLHLMDQTTFEEYLVSEALVGDDMKYLQDNLDVTGYLHEDQVLKISLPNFIETEIAQTEPGLKGDSARAGTKYAKIDTGADIQVPLFIEIGERIKVDTRTGTYVERVKK